ncbi:Ig-like domain-containing protein [Pseudomonas chlororaphis]|uniref:Ig-like domain-containing protein n=1 Tax=Pseudomonas chlororaphis TaxID=587753 RepID=UPI0013DDABDA|nr:Ig-like domain-containing protein [Pseudomonas chlororaphis]
MTNLTNEGITVNTNAVNVAVVDGKTITESVELRTTQQGAPVRIKAVKDGKYILAEGGEKPVAPENLTIKRVGNDLHVATEGTDPSQPQLIIEGFYESHGQLVGVAEDGAYYEYISSDAEDDHAAAFLADGVSSPQVLGSDELVGFGNGLVAGSGIGWFWPALLGLGALGLLGAAYALTRDDDKSRDDSVTTPNTPSIGGATDNVGAVQGPIEKGDSTDDRTPTFTGVGTPGNTIIIEDNGKPIGEVVVGDDGKWEFTPTTPLPEGEHSIIVVEKDKDGNVSKPSDEFDFIVDTTAPGKSVINSIVDDFGDQQGVIEQNGFTDDNTPTLSGTAEAGAKLEIFANGEKIGETVVNADGTWSFTPSPALADGEYSFTTVATDAAGNVGLPSDPYIVIIDTVAPVKPGPGTGGIEEAIDNVGPIQGNIENGDTTDDTTPTFGGGGLNPGDKVTIIDDGVVIGEVIVGEDGRWEFTPDPELSEGPHPITVIVTDPAGNASEPSDPYIVIVDTTAPGKPGIGTGGIDEVIDNVGPIQGNVEDGDTTDDTTPTFGGGGLQPGDKVTIIDDGVVIGEVIVGDDGRWQFTPDPELEEGPHPITVIVTDPAGNESEPSDPYIVIVDTTPPVKPGIGTGGIEEAIDNVGPIVDIGNGGTTDDNTPTFGGGGLQPGDKVTIIDDGLVIGEVIVGDDGRWEFTPDPALEDGTHPITVVVTDPAGNASEESDPYIVIVDTVAPLPPTIDRVWDDQGTTPGEINPGDITDDAQPDISGTAEPGSTVIIYDNGVEIGRELVDLDGNWTHTPVPPLLNGPHELTAKAQDPAGNISDQSNSIDFELVAGGLPPAPSITGVLDDVADGIGNIMPNGSTNDTEPEVSGTAEAFSTVTLFANGVNVGSVEADEFGNWSITPNPALTPGLNNLTATATNAAGNVSVPTGDYPINVDITPPAAATGSVLEDNVGPITDPITSGTTTDDNTPTYRGTAEANTTVIILDNGVEIDRVPVDNLGNWSYTPAPPLADGDYSFSTVVVDAAGNRSPESTPIDFIVDTSAVAISIEQALDNVGPIQDPLASGSVTDDTTPTLRGQATPFSTVNIYQDGVLLQSGVPVNSLGQWEYTVAPALGEGSYAFTATVVTPAGGESAPTADFNLEIDLTASAPPTIDEIRDDVGDIQDPLVDGSTTDDTTPTLVGSGVTGDVVIIRNNGLEIGRVPVVDGSWSFTPNPPLNNGTTNEFDVIAQDPAGNQSLPSAPWTIIIDTDAPAASAVVESMGKDSGADSGDFVTNDGSAGRLIQGSLTAALAADEKVQVSTDGGATWLDVVLNADNSWNFIDQNSHIGDWTIQTRVVDAAGNASVVSQSVSLDNAAPDAPDTFEINGTTVTVTFDGSSLIEGDTIQVVVGSERFEQVLTQVQIDAGTVDVITTTGVTMTNTSAAFIDQAGNSSQVLTFFRSSVNFEDATPTRIAEGASVDFGAFTFRWDDGAVDSAAWPRGIVAAGTTTGEGLVTPSKGLGAWGGTTQDARVTLNNGETATGVTFSIGELTSPMTVRFFDTAGNPIHTVPVPVTGGPNIAPVSATMPAGLKFSYFELDTVDGQYFWLDNFELQGTSLDGFYQKEPATAQTIDGTGAYHGGDTDNVFSLGDVANLNTADSVINGGAGVDTLTLTGTGQVLDLATIAGKLESIEIIDISGAGNNTLNLSLGDVLELGEGSLFTEDETVQMIVKGNAGDTVNLDDLMADGTDPGDWVGQGQVTVEGEVYNVFQHSALDAQLLVQDGVTTNLV